MRSMHIVAMATGAFAVPALKSLVTRQDLRVIALVSRPQRKRSSHGESSPAVASAQAAGIEVVTPPTVNAAEFHQRLEQWKPDLFFVCDYGEILSAQTIALARLGGINLHGSLLPEYRGAAPVAWAILDGRSETGVSVIHMTPRLDAGPILTQARLAIDPDEDAISLERRLAELGASAVADAIELLRQWDGRSPLGTPQDPARATRAPRLRREDGLIDWNRSTKQIINQIRGLQPWPGTFTHGRTESSPELRLQIIAAHALEAPGVSVALPPGTVIDNPAGEFLVATGDGVLMVDTLRPANRTAISGAAFLRGYRLQRGERLG